MSRYGQSDYDDMYYELNEFLTNHKPSELLQLVMDAIDWWEECNMEVDDVTEVRHGRWIEQSPDFDLCGVAYYKCSECGKEQQLNSHYCQFCGAKMDERIDSNG